MHAIGFLLIAVAVLAIAGYLLKRRKDAGRPSNFPGAPAGGSVSGSDIGGKPGRPQDQA